jgi:hypothetical protein
MTAEMIEEWKLVLDFEDAYAVSSLGRIKSLQRAIDRTDGKPCMLRERILRGSVGSDGYRQITLKWAGKKKGKRVHQLVATAFLPARTGGPWEVNHIDCNELNNAAANLEWCSPEENMKHAWRNGCFSPGSKSIVTVNGITETFAQACRRYGIKYTTARRRLERGLSGDAVFVPVIFNLEARSHEPASTCQHAF